MGAWQLYAVTGLGDYGNRGDDPPERMSVFADPNTRVPGPLRKEPRLLAQVAKDGGVDAQGILYQYQQLTRRDQDNLIALGTWGGTGGPGGNGSATVNWAYRTDCNRYTRRIAISANNGGGVGYQTHDFANLGINPRMVVDPAHRGQTSGVIYRFEDTVRIAYVSGGAGGFQFRARWGICGGDVSPNPAVNAPAWIGFEAAGLAVSAGPWQAVVYNQAGTVALARSASTPNVSGDLVALRMEMNGVTGQTEFFINGVSVLVWQPTVDNTTPSDVTAMQRFRLIAGITAQGASSPPLLMNFDYLAGLWLGVSSRYVDPD